MPGFVAVTPGSGVMRICPVSVCHQVSTIGQRPPPDVLLVPQPRLGVDRLADAAEQAQRREVVLRGQRLTLLHERPDRGRRHVQHRDLVVLDDLPPALPGRGVGRALVQDAGRRVRERSVDDVRVARDPADVSRAPVDVVGLDVEDHLVAVAGAQEIARGRVHDALGLRGRPRRVEQVEHVLSRQRDRRAVGRLALDDVVPPDIAALGHRHGRRVPEAAHDEDMLDAGAPVDGLVGRRLQLDRLAAAPAPVRGDDELRLGVVDARRERLGREAAEDHRVGRADAGAGQHRDRELGDHRHVDRDAVAGPHAELDERVRGLLDLPMEVGEGDACACRRARRSSDTRPCPRARPRRGGRRSSPRRSACRPRTSGRTAAPRSGSS